VDRLFFASFEPRRIFGSEMDFSMTYTAHGDEIFFRIASQMAARLPVMDLEIFGNSTSLAAPAIAFEHSLAQLSIEVPVQAKPGLSWDGWIHDAFGIRSKNSWR
jgi:hypothetical protein